MPLIKKSKINPSKVRGHAKPILPPMRRKPVPVQHRKGPKPLPSQHQVAKHTVQTAKAGISAAGLPKKKPYSWQKRDQQRMSNKYGITTYNVDGTVSTVPYTTPEKKRSEWWSEDIVEGETGSS